MSNLFTLPSQRVIDSNTDALAGAKLYFYDPGTTDDRTVYSNRTLATPHAQPVVADAGGLFAPIYLPTGTYKVVLKDADDVTIFTADNVDGPLDTSTFLQAGDLVLDSPVVSKTTTYTVVAGDKGKIINANPTGGSFTITLLSAVTAGDGFPLTIRHVGTANQVTVEATTGQTIDGRVGLSLTDRYQSLNIVSDGANWHVVALSENIRGQTPVVKITDRLTSPPTSPTPGARYIITGTPTGAWSSYSEHDIVEATGTGAWVQIVPVSGWLAWIDDEDVVSVFYDAAWNDWSNVEAPTTSALKMAVWADEKAQNTNGGTPTSGAWTKHDLQTERVNTITGSSLASSVITLPTGKYAISAQVSFYATSESKIRLRNTTDSTTIADSVQNYGANYTSGSGPASILSSPGCVAFGYVDVTEATENIELQYHVKNGPASGLGRVRNVSGETEVYAIVSVLDLTSIQGPAGAQGAQGADGLDAAFDYQFNSATSGDPGAGKYLLNNATFDSVTQINISETTASGADIAAALATWDDSTSTAKGTLKISKEGAPQNYQVLRITGAGTDAGGYWTFPVTPVDDGGTIANGNDVAVLFIEKGDKGDTGATGSTGATGAAGAAGPTVALTFNYSTTTADADPGSGLFRLNNATLASVTEAYFDNNEAGGNDVSAWLDTFDDSGESAYRGTLLLIDPADSTQFQVYKVTGSVTDGTGYRKLALTWIAGKSGGSFTNGAAVAAMFTPRGASGDGDMGSVTYDPAGVAEQLVGLTATQTLTNKTLTQPVITLEQGASVAPTAEGRIAWDTDDNKLKVGDGASTKTFSDDAVNAAAYQPLDAGLTDIAGLAVTDGNIIVGDGANWVAESGATARTSLGLGTGDNPVFTSVNAANSASEASINITRTDVHGSGALIGSTNFYGKDSGGNTTHYAYIATYVTDATDTSEDASLFFANYTAGALNIELVLSGDQLYPLTNGGLDLGGGANFWSNAYLTQIELGHAADTTLTRSAAGEVAIEGVLIKKVGRETIWIPAAAMTARTTNGAASGTSELATNDVMLTTFDFDQTTEEGVGFFVAMPKSWNESTVTFVPYWTAASGSGGVVFGLAAYAFSNDDALDTAVSGQQTSTDTLIAANDCHVGPESSAITIGGTPATNDLVYFEITREVANGSDTLTADAQLIGIHLYITTDASTDT